MKNSKTGKHSKKTMIACAAMAAVMVAGSFAIAFLSDHDNVINRINFGGDSNNDQSVDVMLSESLWDESKAQDIVYGTATPKNPVASNIGTHDEEVFMSVVTPAKAIVVQNAEGQVVSTDGTAASLSSLGLKYVIANNISQEDIDNGTVDKVEITGIKDGVKFGDEITSCVAKINGATTECGGTLSEDGVCSVCGHHYMKAIVDDPDSDVTVAVRELYHFEVKDDEGNIDQTPASGNDAWTAYDVDGTTDGDTDNATMDVYSRFAVNDGWTEITEQIKQATVYVDADGRIYSAHVFKYDETLEPGESTPSLFDAVELTNAISGQLETSDSMNIFVETYGIQSEGLNTTDAVSIWNILTNSEDQENFDLFSVVKGTN